MACKRKNNTMRLQLKRIPFLLFLVLQLTAFNLFAQEQKQAILKLSFLQTDTTKTCKITVLSDTIPVKGTEVHLYVKRMYGLFAIGKATATDESGVAEISFPMDLPGDANNMITVIAKIEGDEIYGDVETESTVKWGAVSTSESYNWTNRSLSASREKAPMILVIASVSIILGIWGTILYLIFQLFRIRQSGNRKKLSAATN